MEKIFYIAELLEGLDKVFTAFGIIFGIGIVASIIAKIMVAVNEDNYFSDIQKYKIKKTTNLVIIFGVIIITLAVALPSKRTYLLMQGGKIVDITIKDNPEVKKIPEKTVELLNAWLDNEIEKEKGENHGE